MNVPPRVELFASTVTPGSTAPDASLTVPSIDAVCSCATALKAINRSTPTIEAKREKLERKRTISSPFAWTGKLRGVYPTLTETLQLRRFVASSGAGGVDMAQRGVTPYGWRRLRVFRQRAAETRFFAFLYEPVRENEKGRPKAPFPVASMR
ncbi:MAG TPA: hypothetical protein VE974_04395 [Thermoanaerobaculia bacterium]|nr:hypothetical protein [Thermoanaerobaculia bacterium]